MIEAIKSHAGKALKLAVAFAPWVIASYIFYWLDSSGQWTSETPHRGKISVAILATGMLLSFLIQSIFASQDREQGSRNQRT